LIGCKAWENKITDFLKAGVLSWDFRNGKFLFLGHEGTAHWFFEVRDELFPAEFHRKIRRSSQIFLRLASASFQTCAYQNEVLDCSF
jgi:hypothetical protein